MNTCLNCGKKYDLEWMTERIKDKYCKVPKCKDCNGVVKPDITFVGEDLPARFFQCAITDFPQCDLLLIMGTSLVVQPFASLVNEVAEEVPRLLINMKEAGRAGILERATGMPGLCYGLSYNRR
ncbi:transcriptional regulator, Sir2 family [Oesophagostomum dentatum]|uniref:Transcriptional regulator, Sir2 family n=1 Tax=Oesophagostomum dentatum TaxID=61180 RepID=A0A0B1RZ51_OESDE|nr:transcriptional regulator, Sir2 family [Oesophagostomum dentatum]